MIVIFDTNVWYAYHMDFEVAGRDGRPVRVRRRNGDAVVAAVDVARESGEVAILDIVAAEVRGGIRRVFRSAAKSANPGAVHSDKIAEYALARFEILYECFSAPNYSGFRGDIERMYVEMWRDPKMAGAVDRRRRIKERHGHGAARPSLATHAADFTILSTAAVKAAQGESVRLVTFDHDLAEFADAIHERFGVVVVDGAACSNAGRHSRPARTHGPSVPPSFHTLSSRSFSLCGRLSVQGQII